MAISADCPPESIPAGSGAAKSLLKGLVGSLALWAGLSGAQTAPTLRFIVGEDWAPPYLTLKDGHPVGGLAFELMEAVARAADAHPSYLLLPPKRTQAALHAGEADLMCMMSPKWVAQPMQRDRVGPPMVVVEDVLAVAPGPDAVKPLDLAAQRGLRVGTVLGYRYAELGPHFDAGHLAREDAATQQGVLEKLARGRTDAAVVDRFVLAQFNRDRAPGDKLQARQVVAQTVTHCLLGGRTQLPPARLQQALRTVAERGELARLLQRYR